MSEPITFQFLPPDLDVNNLGFDDIGGIAPPVPLHAGGGRVTWPKLLGIIFVAGLGLTLAASPGKKGRR